MERLRSQGQSQEETPMMIASPSHLSLSEPVNVASLAASDRPQLDTSLPPLVSRALANPLTDSPPLQPFDETTPASLSVADVNLREGTTASSTALFTVTLSEASTLPVTVQYATSDGSAIAGQDYTAITGSLTFEPGQLSQTIAVTVLGDTLVEPDETFSVTLSQAVNAIVADGQAVGTIQNDDRPPLPSSISLQSFATGLTNPVDIVAAADGSNRLFVVEQAGRIRIVAADGSVESTPFLDIRDRVRSGGEQGLLSLAFPPDFATKQHFYVYYTNQAGNIVISRFRLTAGVADPSSEQIILTVPHPQFSNHNGGKLAFGRDGYLYISIGDGGGGGDPFNNAQNPQLFLGKILRLDVESSTSAPYAIPSSNPFTAPTDPTDRVRDEIWALGLRNPWRISFDRQTADLYIADVGQGSREEVNFQSATSPGGENYGWRILEGTLPYSTGDTTGLIAPIVEYDHSAATGGFSITGGYVYRGNTYRTAFDGLYFYGDFVNGRIWAAQPTETGQWQSQLVLDSPHGISTFGEDAQGELYLADYGSGTLYRVTPTTV